MKRQDAENFFFRAILIIHMVTYMIVTIISHVLRQPVQNHPA